MRTLDIVIRLHGQQNEPELEIGSSGNYSNFYNHLKQAISNRAADIVHKGDYFRYDQHLLPKDTGKFDTYVLFRNITLNESDDDELLWDTLSSEARISSFPEIREKNNHHQLIELSSLNDTTTGIPAVDDADFEEILVRIAGTREELEFDASGPEANKILYERLAKLIYDKEAEVMYKGPRLNFEENRDLFISPDDFSVYVLFRSQRDWNYENNEQLWANLASDLKVLSSITLYKSADNYQVILLTHDNNTALSGR